MCVPNLFLPGFGEQPRFLQQQTEYIVSSEKFTTINKIVVNMVLFCNVSGFPFPTVRWFREGKELISETIFNDYLLANVTENIEASREGIHYYCLATNMIGPENSITATTRSPDIVVFYACKFMCARACPDILLY